MAEKRRGPKLMIKAGTPVTKEPSRWHTNGPGHFPSYASEKMRQRAAAGLGEMHSMQREVARLSRTQPEDVTAPTPRHVISLGDITQGLGLAYADEQRLQQLVNQTSPGFSQKTQTPHLMHAKGRLLSVLRDSMKHVPADTREEVVKRAMAYWKRHFQTDYGRSPTIQFRGGSAARKSMRFVIPAEKLLKGVYSGPGKRTGTPGNYEYDYGDDKKATVRRAYEKQGTSVSHSTELPGAISGMEGPFRYKTGRVLYYDPKEKGGTYYDRGQDRYLSSPEVEVAMNGPKTKKSFESNLRKAVRGGKYYKRVPNPGYVKGAKGAKGKKYRYYYDRESYDRAHPEMGPSAHIGGKRAMKLKALAKLKVEYQRKMNQPDLSGSGGKKDKSGFKSAAGGERLWVKGTAFGLPEQTALAHAKVTGRDKYGDELRQYTAERKPLHDAVVAKFTKSVSVVPPNKKPVAVVMMGGMGSGKGTIKNSVLGDYGDFVNVDPDEIKSEIPEYLEALNIGKVEGKSVTAEDAGWIGHEESADIANKIRAAAMEQRKNVIIDGSGKNAEKYVGKIKELKALGYHVRLVYAHTEMEEANRRAQSRAEKTGRYVTDHVLVDAHEKIPGNFEWVARHCDEFALIRSERPPKIMWSGGNGKNDTIHDAADVADFKALGKRLHREREITLPPMPAHGHRAEAEKLAASFAEAVAFWGDLRKASGTKPPDLTMDEMLKRIRKNHDKSEEAENNSGPLRDHDGHGYLVWPELDYEDETREYFESGKRLTKSEHVVDQHGNESKLLVYRPPGPIDLEWK